jgi:hypothetical protein
MTPAHRRRGRRYISAVRLTATLLLCLLTPSVASAQMCPDRPADFRPHVRAHTRGATIVDPGQVLSGGVWLVPVHCSYGPGPPPVRANEIRAVIVEGPNAGGQLPLTVRSGRLRLRAPTTPGTYRVEVRSVRQADLVPATLRFHVSDPARLVRTRLELAFPRDRPPRRRELELVSEGGLVATAGARSPRRGAPLVAEVALEPGTYRPRALRRTGAPVNLSNDASHTVTFAGSRVSIELDGLPGDGRMAELAMDYADGSHARVPLFESGASLGDDVPPGEAHAHLRVAPRIDPWDPNDPRVRWRTIATFDLVIPAATETVLAWSSASLFAGEPPFPRPWTMLPGRGELREAAPTSAFALAMRDGFAVALGGGAFERAPGGRWQRWLIPPDLVRSDALTPPRDAPFADPPHAQAAVVGPFASSSGVGPTLYAWIDGSAYVSIRGPRGLATERIATYQSDAPYPCYTTGIARDVVSGPSHPGLVVVGRCRGNSPPYDTVPTDGFVAVREQTRWTVRRGLSPLIAIASDDARVVAVGDGGQVVIRDAAGWRDLRPITDDLVGVAVSGPRIVARTRDGALVDVSETARPREIHARRVEGVPHPVATHCFAGGQLVVFHRAASLFDEGSGPSSLPDVVLVERNGQLVERIRSEEPRILALACDATEAWVVIRESSRVELRRVSELTDRFTTAESLHRMRR